MLLVNVVSSKMLVAVMFSKKMFVFYIKVSQCNVVKESVVDKNISRYNVDGSSANKSVANRKCMST